MVLPHAKLFAGMYSRSENIKLNFVLHIISYSEEFFKHFKCVIQMKLLLKFIIKHNSDNILNFHQQCWILFTFTNRNLEKFLSGRCL
jgi:hypothetical protein